MSLDLRMFEFNEILQKVKQKLSIHAYSEMQQHAFKHLLGADHTLLLSQTGSGKTLAFLIPILSKINVQERSSQALIIAPTRELSLQITSVAESLGLGFNILCCYGGNPIRKESKSLKTNPHIVIGTPGRILDHLDRGNLVLDNLQYFILDEFDKTLEMGFHQQMRLIVKYFKHLPQHIFTSATESVEIPIFLSLSHIEKINYLVESKKLDHSIHLIISSSKDKIETVHQLVRSIGEQSVFIFCNYRESTERISQYLLEKGICNEYFHGGMDQIQRENVLSKFRNGSTNILVATDLAGRGLDIPDVENVVHYHLPMTEDVLVHRNGRTARMGKSGNVFLIRYKEEVLPDFLQMEFQDYIMKEDIPIKKLEWSTILINKGKRDKINKIDVVGFLCKIGKLSKDDLGLIEVKDHYALAAIQKDLSEIVIERTNKQRIKGKKALVRLL